MRYRNKLYVRCEKCGQVYHIPRATNERRARCRPCGHEFVIPASPAAPPPNLDSTALGQAVQDRIEAARIATVNLGGTRSPTITHRGMFTLASATFALALFALIASDLLQNVNSLSAKNLPRAQVARFSPPHDGSEFTSTTKLIEAVEPSVVQIETNGGIGSGFVLDKSGLVVTCFHCIENAVRAEVVFANGTRAPVLGVVKAAREVDIAILVIRSSDSLVPLPLADEPPKKGERLVVIGSPAGLSFSDCEGSVSALRTVQDLQKIPMGLCPVPPALSLKTSLVQVSAAVMPGNSGGPIVDFSGNVLGICSFVLDWHHETYKFCISASEIRRLVAHLDDKVTPLCGNSGPTFVFPQNSAANAPDSEDGGEEN